MSCENAVTTSEKISTLCSTALVYGTVSSQIRVEARTFTFIFVVRGTIRHFIYTSKKKMLDLTNIA